MGIFLVVFYWFQNFHYFTKLPNRVFRFFFRFIPQKNAFRNTVFFHLLILSNLLHFLPKILHFLPNEFPILFISQKSNYIWFFRYTLPFFPCKRSIFAEIVILRNKNGKVSEKMIGAFIDLADTQLNKLL